MECLSFGRNLGGYWSHYRAIRLGFWKQPQFGRILLVSINQIGTWLVVGGMTAIGLGFFLGAGPCNATTFGMAAMFLGYLAVPVGLIAFAVAYIRKLTRAKTYRF